MEGSKCEHCLQQCSSALHFGQLPARSVSGGRVVAQLKHRDAATCCTNRGRRGPVTSKGGRGPCGLDRSSRKLLLSPESMYPFCLYLRSLSMGKVTPYLWGEKNVAYSRSELFAPVVKMPTAPTRPQDRPRDNGWVVGLPEGLDGGSEGSANNRPQPASASNTYVPRNGHGLHARFATAYPTELHFIKDEQGRVRGSS